LTPLEELLQKCTVKITVPDGWGTGFFVAPGLILTCAHVVRKAANLQVTVFYPAQQQSLSAIVKAKADDGKTLDLALVELSESLPDHPCVLLDEEAIDIEQKLFSYGYLKSYPNAAPVLAVHEGLTGDTPPLLKLQGAQIEPGISGAALLNLNTNKVCGMIKETRNRLSDLGGSAIPTWVILEQFPELRSLQQQFHKSDLRWSRLLPNTTQQTETIKTADIFNYKIGISEFYGRSQELTKLKKWILDDHCRLIGIYGLGGIGKTSLVLRLSEQIGEKFKYVKFFSLKDAPPLEKLEEAVRSFLPRLVETKSELLRGRNECVTDLMKYLQDHRYLLILDNAESIFQEGKTGVYRRGYEDYEELFKHMNNFSHQSCVILTSRELPKEIAIGGEKVKSLKLEGLSVKDCKAIVQAKGILRGSNKDWETLIKHFNYNAQSLMIVAATIRELFCNSVSRFLKQKFIPNDLKEIFNQQFDRIPKNEKILMYWLAISRENTSSEQLRKDVLDCITNSEIKSALLGLIRRSLIEIHSREFTQQSVIMEYTTERFIEQICKELETREFDFLNSNALIQATAKDYVREAQIRLILKPISNRLTGQNRHLANSLLLEALKGLRKTFRNYAGYAAGNLLNLLCQSNILEKNDYDFSLLTIRQGYLRDFNLQNVNFTNSDFRNCLFTETFGVIVSMALNPDKKLLCVGTGNGEIRLWDIKSREPFKTYRGSTHWIQTVTFSPNGKILASGGDKQFIEVWEGIQESPTKYLEGHTDWIQTLAFSPDGKMLASGSSDRTIRLWNVSNWQCFEKPLKGHHGWVKSIAFSPDGQFLASGSSDKTIRLWNLTSKECIHIFEGHSDEIESIAFSSDGNFVASGGNDKTIRLWNLKTKKCLHIFEHDDWILAVAFSLDNRILASSSENVQLWDLNNKCKLYSLEGHSAWLRSIVFNPSKKELISGGSDRSIRFWDIDNIYSRPPQCSYVLQGHNEWIGAITFTPDGETLISGGSDQRIRTWNWRDEKCLSELDKEHTSWIECIAVNPKGNILASGSSDQTIKLWDLDAKYCFASLKGHITTIRSVAFSPDGNILASSSDDKTIRLWDLNTKKCLHVLNEGNDWIQCIVFSPDGKTLASGCGSTIRLWNLTTKEVIFEFRGHLDRIWTMVFSSTEKFLISGSDDKTIRLWDLKAGRCLYPLEGHTDCVRTIAITQDGRTLASGSSDKTVRLWDLRKRNLICTISQFDEKVRSLAFSPNGQILASGAGQKIKIWNIQTRETLGELSISSPYKGMRITGARGLEETRHSLIALGAISEIQNEDERAVTHPPTNVFNIKTFYAPGAAINLGGTIQGNQIGSQPHPPES
jgi:WD40 repeat protein